MKRWRTILQKNSVTFAHIALYFLHFGILVRWSLYRPIIQANFPVQYFEQRTLRNFTSRVLTSLLLEANLPTVHLQCLQLHIHLQLNLLSSPKQCRPGNLLTTVILNTTLVRRLQQLCKVSILFACMF